MGWMEVLKYRQVRANGLSRFLTDPVRVLYGTWLALSLSRVAGFSRRPGRFGSWHRRDSLHVDYGMGDRSFFLHADPDRGGLASDSGHGDFVCALRIDSSVIN